MRSTSLQAAEHLNRLMALVRGGEGPPGVVDLGARTRGALPLLERVLPRAVRLETELASMPLLVVLDPTHLEQVLVNLVVNARDAMPQGGSIRLRTRREGGQAVLEVADAGTGMPPRSRPGSSTCSSPPRRPERGPAWAWPP